VKSIKILNIISLLVLTFLILNTTLKAIPVIVNLQIPPGISKKIIYIPPNQIVNGYVILESNTTKSEICKVYLRSRGCILIYNNRNTTYIEKILTLPILHISKVVQFQVITTKHNCILYLHVRCTDYEYSTYRIIEVNRTEKIDVELIAPSDSLCKFNTKLEKYTYVIVPGSINPILKIVSGFTGKVHPHFIGFMCIRLIGSGYYTVVILIETPNGKLAPILSVSPESAQFGVKAGIITLEGIEGNSREIIQLWTYKDPLRIVGKYRVVIYVYPYGSNTPILKKVYTIKIICLEKIALILVLFSGLVAIPIFIILLVKSFRNINIKELVTCALISCLIFVTAVIPGYMIWGIASILGPFDWVLWGLFYDILRMMYYGIAISLRPRYGTFAIIMFVTWILNVLYFGRMSILSLLWVSTTAMFYELFFIIFRAYGEGKLNTVRSILSFIPATFIDNYVDLMLYMTLYRLFYADWYVSMYVVGMTIYSIIGFILGLRLSIYLRSVIHE